METGKQIATLCMGRPLTIYNQRSCLWTAPYDYYVTPGQSTLSSAGCGVFSVCHCGQWLTGTAFSPEELAVFSMEYGGRGDDGTDRPALLAAMTEKGWAKRFGFAYRGDGLRNDLQTLSAHLLDKRGVALCNLRVGHIVSLLAARAAQGGVQALALDSYSESMEARVMPHVCEVLPGSEIISLIRNDAGVVTGEHTQYALYWVKLDIVRDFNLLYAL